jgi:hypothetical protein
MDLNTDRPAISQLKDAEWFRKRFVSSLVIALLIAASGTARAQESQGQLAEDREKQEKQEKEEREALDMQGLAVIAPQCFTSGSGFSFLKVCITQRGNISHFESPAGKVHVQTREGYVLCSNLFGAAGVHGFDAGSAEEGWGAPTVSQPGGAGTLPLVIIRNSLDGLVQLKQTFNVIPGEREASVTMAVRNRSTTSTLPKVVVDRYFDGDINGLRLNRYDTTSRSVWGLADPLNQSAGLSLALAPSAVAITSAPRVQTFADWNPTSSGPRLARQCGDSSLAVEGEADRVGRITTGIGDIAPGQTKSLTFRYHGI